mmetsp:Transcript_47611/g.79841  ORF Transcript_47611/g.79841 Transcript_47611/m.79841 type:complete len:85 (-) Transcript_47611:1026-1280(-)
MDCERSASSASFSLKVNICISVLPAIIFCESRTLLQFTSSASSHHDSRPSLPEIVVVAAAAAAAVITAERPSGITAVVIRFGTK